jgi:hypothetical protein
MIAKIVPKSSRNIFAVEGTLLYAAITAIFLFSPEYRTNSRNQISLMWIFFDVVVCFVLEELCVGYDVAVIPLVIFFE